MLSVTSCVVLGGDRGAELRLQPVELAHVRARVRRLEPRHAVRAAQLDDHDVRPFGLAAQWLEEARPTARAHGHRGHVRETTARAGRKESGRARRFRGRWPGSGPQGWDALVQRRDQLARVVLDQVGAELQRGWLVSAVQNWPPATTNGFGSAPRARPGLRRRRRGRRRWRWRARRVRLLCSTSATTSAAGAPGRAALLPAVGFEEVGDDPRAERVLLAGVPVTTRSPVAGAAAARARARRGLTGPRPCVVLSATSSSLIAQRCPTCATPGRAPPGRGRARACPQGARARSSGARVQNHQPARRQGRWRDAVQADRAQEQ